MADPIFGILPEFSQKRKFKDIEVENINIRGRLKTRVLEFAGNVVDLELLARKAAQINYDPNTLTTTVHHNVYFDGNPSADTFKLKVQGGDTIPLLVDSSGNGNDANNNNTNSGVVISSEVGVINTAISFTNNANWFASTDYTNLPNTGTDFTISCWVNYTSVPGGSNVWVLGDGDLKLVVNDSEKLDLYVNGSLAIEGDVAHDDFNFHNVVVTFDSATDTFSLWVDGALETTVGDNPLAATPVVIDPTFFYVGVDGFSFGSYNGVLDEIAIFDYAAVDADAFYQAGIPTAFNSSTSGIVLLYHMDESVTETFYHTTIKSTTGQNDDLTISFPTTSGLNGQVLGTDGAGGMDWVSNGAVTLDEIGSTPNADGMTITGTTLNLEPADGVYGGVLTAGTQTIGGDKTFTNDITLPNGASTGKILTSNANGLATWQLPTFGSAAIFFLNNNTASDVVDYKQWDTIPDLGSESTINTPLSAGAETILDDGAGVPLGFITKSGSPSVISIPAGLWTFGIYASVSSGTNTVLRGKIYTCDSVGGNEILLGTSGDSSTLDGTPTLYIFSLTTAETPISITDRIIVRLYAEKPSGGSITVTTYYDNNSRASYIRTPFGSTSSLFSTDNSWSGLNSFSQGIIANITGNAATVTTNANLTGGVTSVGNAATVVTNANLTGHVTSVGNAAVLGSFTSAQLAAALTDETGTGVAVFGTAPTFTTSITDPLIIGGTATTSTLALRSTSGVGETGSDIVMQTGNNGGTECIRILNNGRVGINKSAPAGQLDVAGNIYAGTFGEGHLVGDGTNFFLDAAKSGGSMIFRTNGSTEAYRATNTGTFGIGETAPAAKLHVKSTTEQLRIGYDASNYLSTTVDSTGNVAFNAVGGGQSFTFQDNILATGNITVQYSSSAADRGYLNQNSIDGTAAALHLFRKSRGSVAVPTVIANGDTIGTFQFQGYDGATYRQAAIIQAIVTADPGASDMPASLVFSTTPDGGTSSTERMRINHAGLTTFTGDVSIASGKVYQINGTQITTAALSDVSTGTTATTFTFNGSGGTSSSVTLTIRKTGNFVTIHFPVITGTSGTGSTAFISNTAISATFRPSALEQRGVIPQILNNSLLQTNVGMVFVDTNGIVTMFRDPVGLAFTNSSTCGSNTAFTMTYFIA
jgi:hypothetical protein